MSVTAIVLAGGRSTRFGGDKLAAELAGASVLASTIRAVDDLADRVIVAGPWLPEGLVAGETPVALVRDPEPFAGPLAALANVLRFEPPDPDETVIVVGGDMPRVVQGVLRLMIDRLAADPTIDAVLLGRPGDRASVRRPVLPLAARVGSAARAARETVEAGDRSLQSFVARLARVELSAAEWLPLDPEAATLTDIDTRADLDRLNAT